MKKKLDYEKELRKLQVELCHLQTWVKEKGLRVIVILEGRDGAGKGGTIRAITERVSPRVFRLVALPAPSDREKSQMYMQRYMHHFPAAGEVVIFDRSWYNRAGVEYVMGFCTKEQHERFLEICPEVEKYITDGGITLIKYWLEVSDEEQERRFRARIDDPLRQWKLSPVDLAALNRWDDYTRAKEEMFRRTDTPWAPWTVVRSNDKRRCRIAALRWVLSTLDYPSKDPKVVGKPDPLIVGPPNRVYEQSERSWSSPRDGFPTNPTGTPGLCIDKR